MGLAGASICVNSRKQCELLPVAREELTSEPSVLPPDKSCDQPEDGQKRKTTGKAGVLARCSPERPFNRDQLVARADKAWTAAGLPPIGLHEARHTCASIFIAAGVNVKALSSYLGHASITITLDRYGHLMPGSQDEAVGLVDGYLERECATAARQS